MTPDSDNVLEFINQLLKRFPQLELLKLLGSENNREFDDILEGILEQAVSHLERNANYLAKLDEETISAFLVAFLSMPGFLRAVQEAYSNGHVDITIEAAHTPLRRRLGEAKIYDGPTYHVKGLEQLIDRYTTGREGSGFIVEYVKKPKIKELVEKVRLHMDLTKPCSQNGNSQDHRISWAFTTEHQHSSGEVLRVLHLNCNLHRAVSGTGARSN